MKRHVLFLGLLASLAATSCNNSNNNSPEVISQRYIHKYGYDVSREDWESQNYPGQVLTTLRNGVTITATYEEGILHGSSTQTYPHSLTLQIKEIYDKGQLTKKIEYDIRGVPVHQEEYISPSSVRITQWYKKGTPLSIEEYDQDALIEGSYYTQKNEVESQVENGYGIRTSRNVLGELLFKDYMEEGYVAARETFHPNGLPYTHVRFSNGTIHGDKKTFGPAGEPLSIEPYVQGKIHGTAVYFQNGNKFHEVPYSNGYREGIERYYVDGENVIEEIEWHDNKRHGPAIVYLDGYSRYEWYFNGDKVSKSKFKELVDREKMITEMHERSQRHAVR